VFSRSIRRVDLLENLKSVLHVAPTFQPLSGGNGRDQASKEEVADDENCPQSEGHDLDYVGDFRCW